MELKDRMKEMRQKKKWTQIDLADKSGISSGMIGGIENGSRNPSKKTMDKLAKAFRVSLEWLETGKENKESVIQGFLNRLIEEGIITSTVLDKETRDMILKAVEVEVAVLLKKKRTK